MTVTVVSYSHADEDAFEHQLLAFRGPLSTNKALVAHTLTTFVAQVDEYLSDARLDQPLESITLGGPNSVAIRAWDREALEETVVVIATRIEEVEIL